MLIADGGTGDTAKVNANRELKASAVSESRAQAATDDGNSYTISSGVVTLTTAGESGIFYIKNNETVPFHLNTAVVSFGPAANGSATDAHLIRVYRNPTTGTLISTATTGPIACNRNFASSNTLSSNLFIGAEGETVTDGVVHSQTLVASEGVIKLAIDEAISPGKTIAFTVEPKDSTTAMKVVVEILGHLDDPNRA